MDADVLDGDAQLAARSRAEDEAGGEVGRAPRRLGAAGEHDATLFEGDVEAGDASGRQGRGGGPLLEPLPAHEQAGGPQVPSPVAQAVAVRPFRERADLLPFDLDAAHHGRAEVPTLDRQQRPTLHQGEGHRRRGHRRLYPPNARWAAQASYAGGSLLSS